MSVKSHLRRMLWPAVLAAALLALLGARQGRGDEDHGLARQLHAQGEILSLERIAELATAQRPGTLIDVELEREDGMWVYEAEILDPEGRAWELELDARTGAVIKLERD